MIGSIVEWFRSKHPPPVPPAAFEPIAVQRARSVLGMGRYRLGRGGRRPRDLEPFDRDGFADCSGFVSWCLGLDRYQPGSIGGDWISCDGIVRDATGPGALFAVVPAGAEVRAGDLVVYPGRHVAGRRVAIGHVGLVSAVPAGWRYDGPASLGALRVIHCAAGRAPGGGAVRESSGSPWARRGLVVRLKSIR